MSQLFYFFFYFIPSIKHLTLGLNVKGYTGNSRLLKPASLFTHIVQNAG